MSKGNFLFATVSGKLGDTVLYRAMGQQRARTYLGSGLVSNPNTESQVTQRSQLANLVAFYRQCKTLLETSFPTKKVKQSDYNAFVSRNLNKTKIYLTKEEAENGTSVVAPYIISYGSLVAIETTEYSTGVYRTNIELGDLELGESTTVAEFTAAVLDNNQSLVEGQKISYASFIQNTNAETGYPYVTLGLYAVELSLSDTSLLYDTFPAFCATTVDGYLGTGSTLASGGLAYILSQKNSDGELEVSTQRIVMYNGLNASFSSSTKLSAALTSYSAVADSVLSTDAIISSSTVTVATSVTSAEVDGTALSTDDSNISVASGSVITIIGNGLSDVTSVEIYTKSSSSASEVTNTVTEFTSQSSTEIVFTADAAYTYVSGVGVDGTKYLSYTVSGVSI